MAIEWNRFWCRVLFKEYIKHYRKMTDEQIVRDVRQSMDDLEDLVSDTDSFGSQMVRWSNERSDEPFATAARENGKKGGRPRKNATTPDTISTDDNALREGDTGPVDSMGRTDAPSRTLPLPTWEDFLSFVDGEGLDYSDAREWWEMTMVDRKGLDRYGKPIGNWKVTCRRFCEAKAKKRSTQK